PRAPRPHDSARRALPSADSPPLEYFLAPLPASGARHVNQRKSGPDSQSVPKHIARCPRDRSSPAWHPHLPRPGSAAPAVFLSNPNARPIFRPNAPEHWSACLPSPVQPPRTSLPPSMSRLAHRYSAAAPIPPTLPALPVFLANVD